MSQNNKTLTVTKKSNVLDKIPPRGPKGASGASTGNNSTSPSNNNSSSNSSSSNNNNAQSAAVQPVSSSDYKQMDLYTMCISHLAAGRTRLHGRRA